MLLRLLMQIIVSVMNEDLKNIETCLPENILAEVASVPTDPQFVSLVEESFDPLQQQAVQQAGSDAYNEVVASHQPYTFTSQVAQMKSNLILLLRRFWRFPFGSGTLRSLSDMWSHYITRLQGSETYGIPSRLDQLTDLPSAPLLVADRKICGADVPDGYSIAHLLGTTNHATEITDNNEWTLTKDFTAIVGYFPNVEKITVNCDTIADGSGNDYLRITTSNSKIKELHFPRLTYYHQRYDWYQGAGCFICPNMEVFDAPNLVTISGGHSALFFADCPITTLSLPKLKTINSRFIFGNTHLQELLIPSCTYLSTPVGLTSDWNCCDGNTALAKVVMGKVTAIGKTAFKDCPLLIHLEFAEGVENSITLSSWSPTLDSSNLQQFLQNFRSFIVLRLANRKTTTALTLTLSANVYNAVTGANSGWASQHTLAELGITDNDLTDLETELGITTATIYATWLDTYTGANGIHWDINKAN